MSATQLSDPKSNRRIASRIYEQANLFYQKIDRAQINTSQPSFDTLLNKSTQPRNNGLSSSDQSLPVSQSQENDTLNVNISASGIAFTCKDDLEPGDYLMLRILLLSSMTVVMTCCKVVYCKPSNPYENDRYPCSVGARFVNMTETDTALLNRHVKRRQKQQWIVNGSLTALVLAILAAPDQGLDLITELGHHLLEIFLHILHLGFEYLEMGLDHLIEHQFHTEMHETQVIVFYVLITLGLIVSYLVGRKIPAALKRISNNLLLYWSRKKLSVRYFWDQKTLAEKIKILGMGITAIAGYVYFTF